MANGRDSKSEAKNAPAGGSRHSALTVAIRAFDFVWPTRPIGTRNFLFATITAVACIIFFMLPRIAGWSVTSASVDFLIRLMLTGTPSEFSWRIDSVAWTVDTPSRIWLTLLPLALSITLMILVRHTLPNLSATDRPTPTERARAKLRRWSLIAARTFVLPTIAVVVCIHFILRTRSATLAPISFVVLIAWASNLLLLFLLRAIDLVLPTHPGSWAVAHVSEPMNKTAVASGAALGAILVLLPMLLFGGMAAYAAAVILILAVLLPLGFIGSPIIRLTPIAQPDAPSTIPEPPPPAKPEPFDLVSGLRMIPIPAGEFMMGSPETEDGHRANEGPQHLVRMSAFYMSSTVVTRAVYRRVMGGPPAEMRGDPWKFDGSDDDLPATEVSWNEAAACCQKLAAAISPATIRLPTEAQWEYACRAGTTTRFWSGDSEEELSRVDWFYGNARGRIRPVGQNPANPFGLHDMHGNVAEWCHDGLRFYRPGPVTDPVGPAESAVRVFRGGSAGNVAEFCRSADRWWDDPSYRYQYLGFRVVLPEPFFDVRSLG